MRVAVAIVVVCWLTPVVAASVVPLVPIEARARGADRVVLGRVADVQSRFDVNEFGDQLIVSDVTVHVEETLKGLRSASLILTIEGGTVGDLALTVSDMPRLRVADRAIFFLDPPRGASVRLHRRGLGVVPFDSGNRVPGTSLTLEDVRRMVQTARQ